MNPQDLIKTGESETVEFKEKGRITNKEYQEVCNTSERTSSRDLADLPASGLFEQIGTTGKGTVYILRRHKAPQRRQNRLAINAGVEKCKT